MLCVGCRPNSETRRHGRRIFWRGLTAALLSVLLTAALLFSLPLSVSAAEAPPPDGEVGNVLLVNLENNLILYEKAADTVVYPASSVKIMAGLLFCRSLGERLDEEVTVTAAMLAGVELVVSAFVKSSATPPMPTSSKFLKYATLSSGT